MNKKKLHVTEPYLPPLEEFIPYLEQIWESKWLTNNGQFHQELEQALCDYLGVKHLALFSNGTLALVTALQALRIGGEVITTPYSFVATTHALNWNGIKPVFVDIDPLTFNIDPSKIEAAITPQTTAILPVHVYGNPCATDEIQVIADKYGLKVIYDAAHAFGTRHEGQSILGAGDLSVLSFHATKVFNTFEGGAIICPDAKTKQRIDHLKNFGFADEVTVVAPGINAKMNEMQAAFGLLQLKHMDKVFTERRRIDQTYRSTLQGIKGLHLPQIPPQVDRNYAYFPVLIDNDFPFGRDALYDKLRAQNIFARRYFYPLISEFQPYRNLPSACKDNLPVATQLAQQVLCLPIYPNLSHAEQMSIINALKSA
ncbi:DegT/DnrJ/EryC1/StrS family aminotransferase [Herminiimonas arsenitoxidans]|uniref:DegT/DnrJ/EryC1/StrS family aminotransferase n=1 Tax=Herminiimonas arsenitoxidans TaxID=1809410 RepID=UPI000970E59D|nr:DegT/DnrJ/EryC1/StrS family aminotransferase [Herminiimonas arsenitoxidans]